MDTEFVHNLSNRWDGHDVVTLIPVVDWDNYKNLAYGQTGHRLATGSIVKHRAELVFQDKIVTCVTDITKQRVGASVHLKLVLSAENRATGRLWLQNILDHHRLRCGDRDSAIPQLIWGWQHRVKENDLAALRTVARWQDLHKQDDLSSLMVWLCSKQLNNNRPFVNQNQGQISSHSAVFFKTVVFTFSQ